MEDYEIKDGILLSLAQMTNPNSYWDAQTIANKFQIAKNRAVALLLSVHADHRCNCFPGYGNSDLIYRANEETAKFLESGGYTKLALDAAEKERVKDEMAYKEKSENIFKLVRESDDYKSLKWQRDALVIAAIIQLALSIYLSLKGKS
jgi:hypothetical protein